MSLTMFNPKGCSWLYNPYPSLWLFLYWEPIRKFDKRSEQFTSDSTFTSTLTMASTLRSRVVGKSVKELDDLTCGICHDLFFEPMVTKCCRMIFCRKCIQQWLQRQSICPKDEKPLSFTDLNQVPALVTNMLNELTVECNVCGKVYSLERLDSHQKSCDSCFTCGFKGTADDHKCLNYLLVRNRELKEENQRLKNENHQLKSENNQMKMENNRLKVVNRWPTL